MTETTAQTPARALDRDALLTALQTAAQDVIDKRGTPGAMARTETLRHVLGALIQHDAQLAVVVTSALWLDRYGTAGAPERMGDLQDALDNLPAPTSTELDALANPAVAASLIDALDGPPCDVDPVAHEDRLAYLEPDDGQD